MRAWLLGSAAILSAGLDAAAHEFWLQPARYVAARDEAVTIGAWIGGGFRGASMQPSDAGRREPRAPADEGRTDG